MIVVDSSALLCLLLGEPEADRIATALEQSPEVLIAAPTKVVAFIVAEAKLGPQGVVNLQRILRLARVETSPFNDEEAELAIEAWRTYGRGRHEAALNLGDCFAYAAARLAGAPLLFVGEDFAKTDITAA